MVILFSKIVMEWVVHSYGMVEELSSEGDVGRYIFWGKVAFGKEESGQRGERSTIVFKR